MKWRFLRPVGVAALVLLLLPGCDLDLEEVNVDTTRLRDVDAVFQLNSLIVNSRPPGDALRCEGTTVQQFVRVSTGFFTCANFNQAVLATMGHQWGGNYTDLRNATLLIEKTREVPEQQNIHNMARIMKAYTAMKITDTYGNVPYLEAGRALEGIVFPVYDSQEEIYTGPAGILEELKNASAALNPSAPTPNVALYGGDITKWRRFGNSLLLRAAMRLTKVAPNVAQQYVQAAVQGGVMQSNADNAVIRNDANYTSAFGGVANGNERGNEYLPATFVDYLQDMNDPRLEAIAVRWPNATGIAAQNREGRVFDPAQQIGMPMGYDQSTITQSYPLTGVSSYYQYSRADPFRIYDVLAPDFLVTYSQTQLLLAEAAHRGWITGNAATFYENAVRADMARISTEYTGTVIPQSKIDAYVAAHPLVAANAFEQINNEYWVASFVMPHEAWSNFRRSGYPAIPPNPYPGSDLTTEDFFRRLLYPESEKNLNEHYADGTLPDVMDTRVWWDVNRAGQGGVGPNG